MTYEEYVEAVRNACKDDLVVKTYPEEFEKVFREVEKTGLLRKDYENGRSPYCNVDAICMMV